MKGFSDLNAGYAASGFHAWLGFGQKYQPIIGRGLRELSNEKPGNCEVCRGMWSGWSG